jgi:hypothetical protein
MVEPFHSTLPPVLPCHGFVHRQETCPEWRLSALSGRI